MERWRIASWPEAYSMLHSLPKRLRPFGVLVAIIRDQESGRIETHVEWFFPILGRRSFYRAQLRLVKFLDLRGISMTARTPDALDPGHPAFHPAGEGGPA